MRALIEAYVNCPHKSKKRNFKNRNSVSVSRLLLDAFNQPSRLAGTKVALRMLLCKFSLSLVLFLVVGSKAIKQDVEQKDKVKSELETTQDVEPVKEPQDTDMQKKIKVVKRIQNTLKQVKQLQSGGIEKTIQTNFLQTLVSMANASTGTTAEVSRAAGTVIRGFVQDQFNLVSIGFYLPRLIFLDGPTQFIETLRLLRTGAIRVPQDLDSAIDTLINFAGHVRESQVTMNVGTPFLSIFPNIFRGSELLAGEILYGVFSWLAPLGPSDISAAAVEGVWNRWDIKSSTTSRYTFDKRVRNSE